MQYIYTAKNQESKTNKGIVEARNSSEAVASLRENGLFVVDIKEASNKNNFKKSLFKKKVQLKDKIIFTKELAMMIKSGLSIVEALEALSQEATNKNFSEVISSMITGVKGGNSLSSELEKHPDIFPEIYVNMVHAGEESGKIEIVLERLTVQLEKDFDLSRKIKSALAYPAFIMVALVAVMVLVMVVIIPQLKLIFDDAGVELPALTRGIIAISNFLKTKGLFLLIACIIIFFGIFYASKKPYGKKCIDQLVVRIPIIGAILRKTYLSRFTRTFSSLAASGLPLMDVFKISSATIGNSIYENEINKITDKVKNGLQISEALKESSLFPTMVGQLTKVGEKSGNIEEVFDQIADFFDRDIDEATGNLSTMLEPVLMAFMGIGIGLIVVSVLQPIYGLVNAI